MSMFFSANTAWIPHLLINSAVTSTGALLLQGSGVRVAITPLNTSYPLYIVAAGLGAANSLVSSYVHSIVKEDIPIKQKAQDEASLILSAMTSALIFNGSLYLLHTNLPSQFGMLNATILAAGSSLTSDFIINMLY